MAKPVLWQVKPKGSTWGPGCSESIATRLEAEGFAKRALVVDKPEVKQQIQDKLMHLRISSCNCLTKTNDIEYHQETCRYRLVMEVSKLVGEL